MATFGEVLTLVRIWWQFRKACFKNKVCHQISNVLDKYVHRGEQLSLIELNLIELGNLKAD